MQVYTDSHVSTKFYWARPHVLSPESSATITWDIPEGTPAGTQSCPHINTFILIRLPYSLSIPDMLSTTSESVEEHIQGIYKST